MSNNALDATRIDVWLLKDILFQATPDQPKTKKKIVMQTLNGPCSFIAICNILILRGDIEILPPEREEAAFEFLSTLVGDYLLKASPDADIAAALSLLPLTQNGLDLNPLFTGASSFRPTGDGASLTLFEQVHIKLAHGWLCDPDSQEFSALLQTEDYDSSVDLIVEADALTKGRLVADWERKELTPDNDDNTVLSSLVPEDRTKVENAIAVRQFLDTTQSQLTYYGLFTLSSKLNAGDLVALFRNSHLSVLHKPYGEASGLYTLVTDHTFAHEDSVIWEKLDDIEGSSQFVDSDFKDSVPVGGDYAGETAETVARAYDEHENAEAHAQDQALAYQLQVEEDQHAQKLRDEHRHAQEQRERAAHNRSRPSRYPITDIHGLEDGDEPPYGRKKKKGDCTIM